MTKEKIGFCSNKFALDLPSSRWLLFSIHMPLAFSNCSLLHCDADPQSHWSNMTLILKTNNRWRGKADSQRKQKVWSPTESQVFTSNSLLSKRVNAAALKSGRVVGFFSKDRASELQNLWFILGRINYLMSQKQGFSLLKPNFPPSFMTSVCFLSPPQPPW